jgi:hypothetical protein
MLALVAGRRSSCCSGLPVLVTVGPAGLMIPGRLDSLLWCSLDVSIAVTVASMLDVCIFTLLSLGGARTNGHWSCRGERLLGVLASLEASHRSICHIL